MPSSRHTLCTLLAPLFLLTAARADSLDARLNALLADPALKSAQVGIDIQELTPKGPAVLFSHNPNLPLEPASNTKLLTTAAAFERYGPSATFKTNLFSLGQDLLLVGGGDPGLGDSNIAAASGTSPTAVFEQWAQTLKQAGISQYRQLILDDRIFDTQWVHPDWPKDQLLDWYSAPIGGLNFNANCLDWMPKLTNRGIDVQLIPDTSAVSVAIKASRGKETRVSMIRPADSNHFEMRGTVAASSTSPQSVPICDPGLWTAGILHDVLARAGIQSTAPDPLRRAETNEQFPTGPNAARLLASHETPILAVMKRANTDSLNMVAECFCKRLGYDATGKPGSWENGTAAVEDFVVALGGKREWLDLADGSGLSHKDHAAARAFTAVLAHVAMRPDAAQFIDTLATPIENGTLKKEKRFRGMAVENHIHAKTGHIEGVSTLSGYILVGDGDARRTLIFSILINHKSGNVDAWEDRVCQAAYEWALGK